MYKRISQLIVCLFFLVLTIIILSHCKKDYTTLPVITLKGDSLIKLGLGQIYTDMGATAFDKKDGDITNKIIVSDLDSIHTDANGLLIEAGQFMIGYHVKDASGNIALEAIRKIHINTDTLAGNYKITDYDTVSKESLTYPITIIHSPTLYNGLIIYGLRQIKDTIRVLVNHQDVSIPFQIFNNISNTGTLISTDTIVGDGGTYNGSSLGINKFSLLTLRYSLQYIGYNHYFISTLKRSPVTIKSNLVSTKRQKLQVINHKPLY